MTFGLFSEDIWYAMPDVVTPLWLEEGATVRFLAHLGNNDRMRARHLRVGQSEFSRAAGHMKFFSSDAEYGFKE